MDPRLLQAISTPAIQAQAAELVRLALRALGELRQLDDSLYERFVASRQAEESSTAAAEAMQKLWDDTFHGLVHLLAYCRRLAGRPDTSPPAVGGADDLDLDDFDLGGDHTGGDADLDLAASDIGDLLAGIDEAPQHGDAEHWSHVLDKVRTIEYGLRAQHADALDRMAVALAAGQSTQVLGLLDDTASSANEGIHALVAAVYDAFLPEVEAASVVPQYLTSLKRALLVRSGLAALGAKLAPDNDTLQTGPASAQPAALAAIKQTLHAFVGSDVGRAMRAADRWELVQFDRALEEQSPVAARLTAEGLVKYLESLGAVNQREVLVLHDQRLLGELREALSTARELVDISPRTVHDELHKARQAVGALRGRNPATDRMLDGIAAPEAADDSVVRARLEELLAAFGG